MSYWSHHPEKLNEIVFLEAMKRASSGELNVTVEELAEAFYEDDKIMYYFLTSRFGEDVASEIMAEAECDYWSGYTDYVYETQKERYLYGKEERSCRRDKRAKEPIDPRASP